MRRLLVVVAALLITAAPAAAAASTVEVAFTETSVSAVVGQRLALQSRVTNTGTTPTEPLIAHINVASLDASVYVDLEDWSSEVTFELAPLAPGASQLVNWELQAVNAGEFGIYVVVLPRAGSAPPAVSAPLRAAVAGRRTLSAGGALPVIVAVPVVLGLLAAAALARVRRPG